VSINLASPDYLNLKPLMITIHRLVAFVRVRLHNNNLKTWSHWMISPQAQDRSMTQIL
jgi:hypothetical protein